MRLKPPVSGRNECCATALIRAGGDLRSEAPVTNTPPKWT